MIDRTNRTKGTAIEGGLLTCWMCRRAVSARALFCHGCGAVQPVRDLDPFTRLGLERRFDIDLAQLNRQYVGFRRAMTPERFANRGAREKTYAKAQTEAFAAAYEALKDPVRRARHLLGLTGAGAGEPGGGGFGELAAEFDRAGDATVIDRLANKATHEREAALHRLAGAFRLGQLDQAAVEVARVEALDRLLDAARERRGGLPVGTADPA